MNEADHLRQEGYMKKIRVAINGYGRDVADARDLHVVLGKRLAGPIEESREEECGTDQELIPWN